MRRFIRNDLEQNRVIAFSLTLAIVLGGYVRLVHVVSADFPMNDGGLFFTMTQELIRNGFALPTHTLYNSLALPFAYPPLGFYLAGLLSIGLGLPLLDIFRLLPAIISVFTIPVVYKLSYGILQSPAQAILAMMVFAFSPRSFEWMIMGGGLTRSLGFLFALLTLWQVYLLYTQKQIQFIVTTIVFGSLLVLSHPELTWFAIYSVAIFFLVYGRNHKGLVHSILVAIGVFFATSPWWLTLFNRGQLSSLLSAAQSGFDIWYGNIFTLLVFDFSEEPFLKFWGLFGLLGFFACCAERRFFLPLWLVVIFPLQPRSGATYATVPLAMLSAICVQRIILPGLVHLSETSNWSESDIQSRRIEDDLQITNRSARLPRFVLGFLLLYAFFSAWIMPFRPNSPLRVLRDDERQALQWVARHTPEHAEFLVITGDLFWRDYISEWFPALAQRASLATVQGYEWLPDRFYLQWKQYVRLQACVLDNAGCLERWAKTAGVSFTHVYIPKTLPQDKESKNIFQGLEDSVRASKDYVLIYDGPGASIYARQIAD